MIRTIKRVLRKGIEGQGYFVRPLSEFGFSFSADIRRLLGKRLQPCIVDVGANTGQWLKSIKATYPDAQVYCYEPDERAFAQLLRTANGFSSVQCLPCALGREAGVSTLFRNADSVTSSLLQPAPQAETLPYAEKLQPVDTVKVEVRRLSDELRRLGIQRIDLLKSDCQGADLNVLEGAAQEIDNGQIHLISTEALFHLEYEKQAWFHQILAWLGARGFVLIGLYDVLHDKTGRALFGDALFARIAGSGN